MLAVFVLLGFRILMEIDSCLLIKNQSIMNNPDVENVGVVICKTNKNDNFIKKFDYSLKIFKKRRYEVALFCKTM